MRFVWVLCSVVVLQSAAFPTLGQTINISEKNTSISAIFRQIRQQSGYDFLYNKNLIKDVKVTVKLNNASINQALEASLKGLGLTYKINDKIIFLERHQESAAKQDSMIYGLVIDQATNVRMPGVTITNVSTKVKAHTDVDGAFEIPGEKGTRLLVSYIGYETAEILVQTADYHITVNMKEAVNVMEDVVVNGIFTRKKESFTGSAATFGKEELLRVGNQNVIKSLANLDPSFKLVDNLQFGSDPNRLPDIQLRGQSGLPDLNSEFRSNPNLPLFIVDGFESTLQKVIDLDIYRVASVTVLKDAASKSIYGSRAANGVVVIETVRPAAGKLQISFNNNINVEVPDLRSYNLVNSMQKLDVELAAGIYSGAEPSDQVNQLRQYNRNLEAALSGVNTDWLAQPVRNGVGYRNSIRAEGGDAAFRYGVDLMHNKITGTMKGSDRNTLTGAIDLSYRLNNISINNILTITSNKANNSPYGSFENFARLNPYNSPFDRTGKLQKIANYNVKNGTETEGGVLLPDNIPVFNPLWNGYIGVLDNDAYTDIINNFNVDWRISSNLRINSRFSVTKQVTERNIFLPPDHTSFGNFTGEDVQRKGSYTKGNGSSILMNGNLNLSYLKQIDKHYITFNSGVDANTRESENLSYIIEGFKDKDINFPSYGLQYQTGSRLTGIESIRREAGAFASTNYSFDDRYLMDASLRFTGNSQFGTNNKWGTFWSLGLGWNIHKEKFIAEHNIFDQLRLRGTVGYTGSQDFESYLGMTTFQYIQDRTYLNGNGSFLVGMANPNLRWQRKKDNNVGLDMTTYGGKLNLTLEYYLSYTDGLLTQVSLPPSSGFQMYTANLGEVKNTGWEGRATYSIFKDVESRKSLSVYGTFAQNKNTLIKISNSLGAWNKGQDTIKSNLPKLRFIEGQSLNSIWAVRSLGIDPSTGREIYLTKDGDETFEWNADDQVAAGDLMPKLQGNLGFDLQLKGWQFNVAFAYRWGGQMYNQTLLDKVENANIYNNVDRRVLNDRWRKPGDQSFFKDIANPEVTRPSTRFVEDWSELTLSTINVAYELERLNFIQKIGLRRAKLGFNANNLFVISTVRQERGTDYPFARTLSSTLQILF